MKFKLNLTESNKLLKFSKISSEYEDSVDFTEDWYTSFNSIKENLEYLKQNRVNKWLSITGNDDDLSDLISLLTSASKIFDKIDKDFENF